MLVKDLEEFKEKATNLCQQDPKHTKITLKYFTKLHYLLARVTNDKKTYKYKFVDKNSTDELKAFLKTSVKVLTNQKDNLNETKKQRARKRRKNN